MTRLFLIAALAVSLVAQENPREATSVVTQAPDFGETRRARSLDVSAVVLYRDVTGDHADEDRDRELMGTLFVSKNIGRWQWHAKVNANGASELDRDGLAFFRSSGHITADLDAAWLNCNVRDWLQWRSGVIYIPTYWGIRRYQATTLTPHNPLIDQDIFPAAFLGTMVHGDFLGEEGGFSYAGYGGKGYELDPLDSSKERIAKPRLYGGKLSFHVPTAQRIQALAVAYHSMRGAYPGKASEVVQGLEFRADHGRFSFVSDSAGPDSFGGRRACAADRLLPAAFPPSHPESDCRCSL